MNDHQETRYSSESNDNTKLSLALPKRLSRLKRSSMMIDLSPVSELTFNFEHSQIGSTPSTPTSTSPSKSEMVSEGMKVYKIEIQLRIARST